jgi:hypothetical protein
MALVVLQVMPQPVQLVVVVIAVSHPFVFGGLESQSANPVEHDE